MNNYFCVLPFYGIEYQRGTTTPCCLLPNDTNLTDLKKTMLDGVRPSACQKCWTLEDQNKISNRQIQNQTFDLYLDRDIRFIEEDCRRGLHSTQIIKLYTSNLCNGTCVVCCDDNVSTAWGTLQGRSTYQILEDTTLSNIDYADIKILSFVGGEPLFEKKNYKILQQLIEHNNTNCFISMVTNGAVDLSPTHLSILKQFKNLNLCLSIDGVGPVFEYLRYPLKWDKLLANIELYKQLEINLTVSYTISNLNLMYHYETTQWFESMGLSYNYNLVSDPEYFSIDSLPLKFKDSLLGVSELLREHRSIDDYNYQLALAEIDRQDLLKKISIKDYLPELVARLESN